MENVLDKICRCCIQEEHSLCSVFTAFAQTEESINVTYADMLMYCCDSIQIEENDGLPKQICQNCTQFLTTSYLFKRQCESNETVLKAMINKSEVDNDINEDIEELTEGTVEFLEEEFMTDDPPDPKPEQVTLKAKEFTCKLCNEKFPSVHNLRLHKKTHICPTTNKLKKCKICDKEFRSIHGLRYHMKIHFGIKNYPCTFGNCNKRFRLKQALEKHLNIHNKEKNHLCPLCGKIYSAYDSLQYHLRTHKGERPFLCLDCGKSFKQSCHLKAHMWVHSGIKPYVCHFCGKCYTSGHQLKKHFNNKHSFELGNMSLDNDHY